ncbi:MAG TPA: hypothetical protein PK801_06510 [Aggregatilineales bacterium]|nr:hypothetical protein [Chloroflexota bacterium]HOA23133.1 hypothetical protein [Aggregatilineales bacterium]HPV07862.1 hypothetical protein [Aggregatilineales bacterium]HQA67954.1 hypothetical protein [Aggregatilineales bacterium]HQE17911.1 hypothetical protein [Aggregatilineales bacterium]
MLVFRSLWAAFILADGALSAYDLSQTHRVIFIAQLLTLLTITPLQGRQAERVAVRDC